MQRRSLFRATPVLLGVAAGATLLPVAANAEPTKENDYISNVARLLNITFEQAADLWAVKENREILPVAQELITPDEGLTTLAAQNSYTASHTFNNLFGQELLRVTVTKTVVTMSAPVTPVSASASDTRTALGATSWISEGPQPNYNIDERRSGGSHYSRRASSWSARGTVQGRVILGVGILAKVGNLHTATAYNL